MDVGDVGVVQGAGGARLSSKASLGGFIGHQMPGQKLDGHGPLQLEVHRSIQDSHRARAQPLFESVVRQHAADKRVHAGRRLAKVRLLRTMANAFGLLRLRPRRHAIPPASPLHWEPGSNEDPVPTANHAYTGSMGQMKMPYPRPTTSTAMQRLLRIRFSYAHRTSVDHFGPMAPEAAPR